MRELSYDELEEVNGGVAPVVVYEIVVGGIVILASAMSFVANYITISNEQKRRDAEQAAQQAAEAQQTMVYGPYPVPPYIDPLTLQYMQYYGLCP